MVFPRKTCGFILYARPLFQSESNDKILSALNEAFPDRESRPSYVWLDKACQFWYWLLDSKRQDKLKGWNDTIFLIDRFHQIAGHLGEKTAVARFCKEYCHSSIERYEGLRGVYGTIMGSSEAVEQTCQFWRNVHEYEL